MDDNSVTALKRPAIGPESDVKRMNGIKDAPLEQQEGAVPAAPLQIEPEAKDQPQVEPETTAPMAITNTHLPNGEQNAEVAASEPIPEPQSPKVEPASPRELKAEPVNQAEEKESETEIETQAHITEHEHEEEGSEEGSEEEEEEDPTRIEAIAALTDIEVDYANLKMRIHNDQAARLDLELQLCLDGSHPELEHYEARIRDHRDSRHKITKRSHEYELECIQRTIQAKRAALHQQFAKDAQDVRTELLRHTTREWYQVNDERRIADKLVPDLRYRAPELPQTSVLVAISQHCGFPAAPSISGVSEAELGNDLNALDIKR